MIAREDYAKADANTRPPAFLCAFLTAPRPLVTTILRFHIKKNKKLWCEMKGVSELVAALRSCFTSTPHESSSSCTSSPWSR